MTIPIPMWLLYVIGGIIAIILLFCLYIGIIVMYDFYKPFKKLRNENITCKNVPQGYNRK